MVKISAGSYDLNNWLFGGYETDIVTVIYGGSGTGKTNFCLLAAISQAKKGDKVIYMDTEGGFSVERVKQLSGEEYEKVLENIILLKPTSFTEQKEAFKELERHIKEQVSLIVVDGLTILYRLDFADAKRIDDAEKQKTEGKEASAKERHKVNAELVKQIKTLAVIARKRNIPVLVTNQVYNWEDESKMVGGDILKYWGKCWIELVNKNSKRTACLRKHRSLPEKSLDFQITNEGIRKRGWI